MKSTLEKRRKNYNKLMIGYSFFNIKRPIIFKIDKEVRLNIIFNKGYKI